MASVPFFLDKHYISVATDKSSSTEKSYSGDSRGSTGLRENALTQFPVIDKILSSRQNIVFMQMPALSSQLECDTPLSLVNVQFTRSSSFCQITNHYYI